MTGGITLVALIITIIILIILAAITIKTLTHDGLVDMAIKGAQGYKTAEGQELEEMNKLSNRIDEILSGKDGEKEPVVIEGVITFGELTWANHRASVTVNKTTSDSLNIEYQVLNKDNQIVSDYQTIANGGTVSNLNLGDFVIARLTDGRNHGNTASIEVTDANAPTAPTFGTPTGEKKLSTSEWYTGDVTVGVTPGTDSESGVLKTTYTVTGAQTIAETEGTSVTITAEGTSVITAYTYDNAGHKTASNTLTVKIDKTAPPLVSLSISEKTGSTITVGASMSNTTDTSGIAKYIFEYKKSTESDASWKTAKEEAALPSEYTYAGLEKAITYNFRVKTQDNAGNEGTGANVNETTNDYDEPMNPNIDTTYGGLTVDYTPKAGQVYNTEGKINTTASGSAEYSGYGFQYFLTSDLPAGWQVWGTDDNYIYIISTSFSSKNLGLSNYIGYNNGVTLLDNICDIVYTDKTTYPGSKGQNLKLEQVLAVTASTISPDGLYGTAPYSYSFAYPIIWSDYEQSKNDSLNNRSKAYGYVAPNSTDGTKLLNLVKPYDTRWVNYDMSKENAWVNSSYYDMVANPPGGNNVHYYLSSRCVLPSSGNTLYFSMLNVSWGCVGGDFGGIYGLRDGESYSYGYGRAFRPVVSFPKSMYRLDTSTTPAKIVKK